MSWDLNQRLEGYERLLSRQAYLAGDQLTLADLFHMPDGIQVLQVRVCEAAVVADWLCLLFALHRLAPRRQADIRPSRLKP